MQPDKEDTRFERKLRNIKNNQWLAPALVVCLCIIGAGTLAGSIESISKLFDKLFERRSQQRAGQEQIVSTPTPLSPEANSRVSGMQADERDSAKDSVFPNQPKLEEKTGQHRAAQAPEQSSQEERHENGQMDSQSTSQDLGLKGEYFNAPPFDWSEMPSFPEKPETIRIDKAIEFNWGKSSPAPRVSADYFMVRWSGELYAPISGTYRFRGDHNDACRLSIDGKWVLEDWAIQKPPGNNYGGEHIKQNAHPDRPVGESYDTETVWTFSPEADVYLEGDRWYEIHLDFLDWKDEAFIRLYWRPPGDKNLALIPTRNLRSLK